MCAGKIYSLMLPDFFFCLENIYLKHVEMFYNFQNKSLTFLIANSLLT